MDEESPVEEEYSPYEVIFHEQLIATVAEIGELLRESTERRDGATLPPGAYYIYKPISITRRDDVFYLNTESDDLTEFPLPPKFERNIGYVECQTVASEAGNSVIVKIISDTGTPAFWQSFISKLKTRFITISDKEYKLEAKSEKPPWEQITGHLRDRDVLRLWWKGKTNTEIGKAINMSPRAVTNLLCILRKKYGEKIVPKNEQRWKNLLEKTRDKL